MRGRPSYPIAVLLSCLLWGVIFCVILHLAGFWQ
jgi:hypothetical protein